MQKNIPDNPYPHIMNVSWTDHLMFGEADGRLASPEALERRLREWRDERGTGTIHWRHARSRVKGKFHTARDRKHPIRTRTSDVNWDDFTVVPQMVHRLGMQAYLYVWLFDEGWPLASKKIRAVSYHNAMHGQHVSWQSIFSAEHPDYTRIDRAGKTRQWGVLSLSYPEVREHFHERYLNLLENTEFDGLFISLRSQSRPADFADQYEFNAPVVRDFLERYGRNILREDFSLQPWRDLLGEYLTTFIKELKQKLSVRGIRLAIGTPRGDILGPPMGNTTLDWRRWIQQALIDELIIHENSSKCPSMWHDLWPMHRGYGYLQNYIDGLNLPPLIEQLETSYAPVFKGSSVELYVARQWDLPSEEEETTLLTQPCLSGLVLSSFRYDNSGPIARGDWTA